MKQFVMAGTIIGALAFGAPALAQKAKPSAAAGHAAPNSQPTTAEEPNAPGAMVLGTVRLPKGVKADGKELAAGSYQVRLTADEAKPDAKGSSEKLERWVEFVKGGKVAGREVVSIVPAAEVVRGAAGGVCGVDCAVAAPPSARAPTRVPAITNCFISASRPQNDTDHHGSVL